MVTKRFESLTRSLGRHFGSLRDAALATAGVAACCVAVAAVQVTAATTAALTVSNAWMRWVGPSAPVAAYFTLSNLTAKSRVLVRLSSPGCGMIMMHRSQNVNGVSVMTVVTQRIVPSHSRIAFEPGGFHLMCISPSDAVRPGARIPVTLGFSDGQHLTVRFLVRPLGPGAAG